GHQADNANAGNQHAATADAGGHHGMHGAAERVENGRDVVGDVGMDGPDVFFGHSDVFGETAVGVDSQNIDLFADVSVAGAAGLADAAADVTFGADPLADGGAIDGVADRVNAADELVGGGGAKLDGAIV